MVKKMGAAEFLAALLGARLGKGILPPFANDCVRNDESLQVLERSLGQRDHWGFAVTQCVLELGSEQLEPHDGLQVSARICVRYNAFCSLQESLEEAQRRRMQLLLMTMTKKGQFARDASGFWHYAVGNAPMGIAVGARSFEGIEQEAAAVHQGIDSRSDRIPLGPPDHLAPSMTSVMVSRVLCPEHGVQDTRVDQNRPRTCGGLTRLCGRSAF